ncbi:polysaccharide deacetylase family sporulation protein PdaB [Caldanaerobius fijiensis DSM 17918]|uniref:Polysaccharide deacetylase family sporulation protein PdaB n=2 Tax=Caldanaerobius TaxID=862261 RepID=A0A1M4WS22_9THEO|nr:polysaccharide deacetylase family protein [Caldanaerobius fijiensis]SHE83782.1 polysaccharide deacetylase family sporulation protein PdaB [Caldanaerobius fijiensis DSM 17918]
MKIYYIKPKKTYVFIAVAIVVLIIVLMVLLFNSKAVNTMNQDPIYKGSDKTKTVAFACNVAWGDEYLTQMLDYFDSQKIKITFFFEGNWAEKNKNIVKEIYQKGHEIGSHGYTHVKYSTLSTEQIKKDILKNDELLKSITGQVPLLFAPPYGDFNDTTVKVAEELGHKVIMWSVDTIDWRGDGTPAVVNRVLKKYHNGAIILMHPTKDTVEALPTIVNELKRNGFKIGRVSDVL